jgi:TPR repeat protein
VALADRFAGIPVKAETEPTVSARAVQEPPAPAPTPPILRQLDPEEVALLLKRGEVLIAQGDIVSARLMLTRAAEAGDARAALTLGASYDPDMLRKLGVMGVAGDAAKARAWYEKAAGYGSGEATRRLEQFAHSTR